MSLPLFTGRRDDWTPQEYLTQIIEPVLCHIEAFSQGAAQLLLGTALHEGGGLRYRRQIGGGPGRSFFQIEVATHDDIWDNYLVYNASLAARVESLIPAGANKLNELENNDNYAAAMCRVHYLRQPGALPAFNDLEGQARYWKQYYNTPLGAGTTTKYLDDWNTYVTTDLSFRSSC
ncbi:MAG: hypothetical protein AB1Z98_36355 [Nannocystaceae bacterium]